MFGLAEKTQKVCTHKINFHLLPESDKIPTPIVVDQYANCSGCPNFQNFWSYISIQNSQIATNCSVLKDPVFFVLSAYFDGSMVFFDEFLPQKSWNTVYIIQKQNMNWFDTAPTVVVCFLLLTDLMKVLLSFV